MPTWKFLQTLTQDEANEWQTKANQALGVGTHEKRKTGFSISRAALRALLIDQGHQIKIADMDLENFNTLKKFPQLTVSLTHSGTFGAAVLANRSEYRAVGIDLELKTRVVKAEIKARIANPTDANLTNIELWCAKEAAFKCLMNTEMFSKNIDFKEIVVGADFWFHPESGLRGELIFHLEEDHLISLAYLKN